MQVSAPLALGMLNDMTGLQRLNLQSFGDLNDAHLTQIASRLPSLQQLKVLMAPPTILNLIRICQWFCWPRGLCTNACLTG